MPILFLCVIWGAFHTPMPALFTIRFPLPFSSFYFSASLAESKPRQSSLEAFCLPCKGRWVAEGKPEGFHRNLRNLKRMAWPLIRFCLPCKWRWIAEGNSEGFHRNLRNLKRMCVTFNPLFASLVKGAWIIPQSARGLASSSWREPVPFVTTWHFPTPWGITLYKGTFWHFPTLWGITLFDVPWKRLQCKFGSRKRHLCKKSAIFCRNFEISADWRIINTLIIYSDGVIINILCSCSFTPHRCIRHFFKFAAV